MNFFDTFLEWLSNTSVAEAIRSGGTYFPWLECIHVVAIALVLGTIAIVDLRLVGYRSHRKSANRLIVEMLPFTWGAFVVAAISGLLMFSSNAVTYAHDMRFQFKMLLIVLAGINMAVFHSTTYRRIHEWDEVIPTPSAARTAGVVSLCLWVAVAFLGRWMGF